MIGINSLTNSANRRSSAHPEVVLKLALEDATHASSVGLEDQGVYPRPRSLYTFRTPSPGGQFGAISRALPAFFFCTDSRMWRRCSAGSTEPTPAPLAMRPSELYSWIKTTIIRGYDRCTLNTFSPLWAFARYLRPVAIQSPIRPSPVRLLAQARPLSPMAQSPKVPSLVRRAISRIASSTRAAADQLTSQIDTANLVCAVQDLPVRPIALARSIYVTPTEFALQQRTLHVQ